MTAQRHLRRLRLLRQVHPPQQPPQMFQPKFKNNKLESFGNSITEGIGTGRITKNFDKALVDDAFQTDDVEALNLVFLSRCEEGGPYASG